MIDKQGLPVTRKIQTSSGRLNPTDRQERVKKVCELMNGGHSYRQALRIMHELGYSISLHQVWLDFETNRSQITQSNIEAEQCKQTQLELPIEQPSFFG